MFLVRSRVRVSLHSSDSSCTAFPGLLPARCQPRRRRRRGHHPGPKLLAPKPGVGGRDGTGRGGNSHCLLGAKSKALQLKLGRESRLTGVGKHGWRGILALALSQGHGADCQQGRGVCPPLGGAGRGFRPGFRQAPGRCLYPGSCCPWHWAEAPWSFLWRDSWSLRTLHAAL